MPSVFPFYISDIVIIRTSVCLGAVWEFVEQEDQRMLASNVKAVVLLVRVKERLSFLWQMPGIVKMSRISRYQSLPTTRNELSSQ